MNWWEWALRSFSQGGGQYFTWHRKANYVSSRSIFSLIEYNDKIYAGTGSTYGELYEWDGISLLVKKANAYGKQISDLVVFNEHLYGITLSSGDLLRWDDVDTWVKVANGPQDAPHALRMFDSHLFCVNKQYLYMWDSVDTWILKGTASHFLESLVVFNNKLYCAAGIGGHTTLYEWDGVSTLTEVAPTYTPEIVNDAISFLIVYDNQLHGLTHYGRLLRWNNSNAWGLAAERYDNDTHFHLWVPSWAIVFLGSIFCAESGISHSLYGRLLEWDGNTWNVRADRYDSVTAIQPILNYHNKIYGGGANYYDGDKGYLLAWE